MTEAGNNWSVGLDVIDEEHSSILALITQLAEIRSRRRDPREIAGIVAAVSAYTEYHFRTEEAVLEAVTFPGRDGHKRLHQTLKARTNGYLRRVLETPAAVDVDTLHAFLEDWWQNHILREDMAYRPYVENNADARAAAKASRSI